QTRVFIVKARMFAFDPATIRVRRGDHVVLKLTSLDVVHGIYIDAYGINKIFFPGEVATVEFDVDRAGKFKFRCSYTCGNMHPFMLGQLIVEPNYPFRGAAILALLVAGGTVGLLWRRRNPDFDSDNPGSGAEAGAVRSMVAQAATTERFDLLQIGFIRRMLRHRAFQYTLMAASLLFFLVIILTALFGTPIGSHNFAIVFVWIVWWALLITILLPFGARFWCTICPLPALGEWLQRLSFIRRRNRRPFTLGKVWPKRLRNIWLQNFSFLGVALFSAVILTVPLATGLVLLSFIILALNAALIFQRRTFCRYICSLGGFISLYSMVSPVEIRAKDPKLCERHGAKECIRGSEQGYGCSWMEYPGTLDRNAYCGMCTECIKTCPLDNIAVNIRPFGTDLIVPHRRMDEAYKAFIMLASAGIYSAVMLGPWGWLKDWANLSSLPHFGLYALGLLATNLVVVPGAFWLFSWLGKLFSGARAVPVRRLFVSFAYTLVPLGLMAWVAFTFSFIFTTG
ncbi:MAG: cupredoxin domain-containing protein, partial [Candidatus Bipolaricaulia bacterium]